VLPQKIKAEYKPKNKSETKLLAQQFELLFFGVFVKP
jgi:hypothetical protein